MIHALVTERRAYAVQHLKEMHGFYLLTVSDVLSTASRVWVRTKWSGRLDEIRIITNERDIHGHRFDGQILQTHDSFAIDGLLQYVRYNIQHGKRRGGALHNEYDPETLWWHWATRDSFQGQQPSENPCHLAAWKSILAARNNR